MQPSRVTSAADLVSPRMACSSIGANRGSPLLVFESAAVVLKARRGSGSRPYKLNARVWPATQTFFLNNHMAIERKGAPDSRRAGSRRDHEAFVDRLVRRQTWMDGLAEGTQGLIGGAYKALGRPGQALKNAMHGTTIPAAGDFALAIGIAAGLLAALTGSTDFHDTYGHERRLALTHGAVMSVVVVAEITSFAIRIAAPPTSHIAAVDLATGAWLLALAGAYVGGHLTFALGTAVNRNAFAEGPAHFVKVGSSDDFPEAKKVRTDAGGLPALIVRKDGVLHAIGAVCSHAGGPLEEGTLDGDVVTCPWHSSRFCIDDGHVTGGPATFSQPPLLVRERNGAVEVRLAHPLH
ncbi:MAG: Rieske (2Fe-2S) protein [Chloroflexi bacterium]|nr:MAG: Rieske (2Fe-2S) protein [Chloroflexota bacterium]